VTFIGRFWVTPEAGNLEAEALRTVLEYCSDDRAFGF